MTRRVAGDVPKAEVVAQQGRDEDDSRRDRGSEGRDQRIARRVR
jgi:hypothetical protein